MIIPVRCFTCGKVLADKWRKYDQECKKLDMAAKTDNDGTTSQQQQQQPLHHNFDPVTYGAILDGLDITRVCCRRHMLGHVDLIDMI